MDMRKLYRNGNPMQQGETRVSFVPWVSPRVRFERLTQGTHCIVWQDTFGM